MNRKSLHVRLARRLRGASLAGGLALVCLLMAGNVSAQAAGGGVTTTDPGALAKLIAQLAKLKEQYEKQVQQYQLQLQQYEQMFINIKNLGNQVPNFNNQLQHLDANAITQAQCGSGGGGGGSSWFGGLMVSVFAPTSPYAQSQHQICQNIVAIQVLQYNATADMLNRMNGYVGLANTTENLRSSVGKSNTGDLQGNTNQVVRYSGELDLEMSNWQARMKGYDAEISALQATQSILAKAAMSSRTPDLLGTSVQAAALKAALTVNQ